MLALTLTGCNNEPATPEITEVKNGQLLPGYYYVNKLCDGAADPFVLEHEGMYYLYCTGGSKFTVRTSQFMNIWQEQSTPIIELSKLGWAEKSGWAPEMHEYNGKFYFIFSAQDKNDIHCIDIAVSDTPNGEFKPLKPGEPFFAPGYSVIDGSLFFDDDGRVYMYYSKDCSTNHIDGKNVSQIYGVELEKDFSGIIGEPVLISTPEQDWELKSGNTLWNEGPVVFKENGRYYLLYSANCYSTMHYSVGYATSDAPLKKFEKPKEGACVIKGDGETVTGPGHCNILRSPDGSEIYVVYHVHTVPPNIDHGRSLAIDRLVIREDGTLDVDGPSTTRRLLPSGVNGYYHVNSGFTYKGSGEMAEFASKSKLENLFDGMAYGNIDGVYSMADGGSVEIKLDEPKALAAIWVYLSQYEDYTPRSIDVLINGKYLFGDLTYVYADFPIAVNPENLPEGTLIEDIKVTVHTAEGKEYAALSEIMMVTARQK